ncbi:MAG: type 1 glutamine amidotransferase domain-containing protein [Candidatus Bathyarchaeia archaeon]
MKKILIMVGDDFEDSEFFYPYYRMMEEGYEVEVIASEAREIYCGKYGITIQSDVSPESADIDKYDALIIPGGRAPDRMRCDGDLVNLVKKAYEKGKVIAAICHGPQMLIEADVVKGKKATCARSISTDLKNAGATYVEEPVVADGQIVTSRHLGDLPHFCKETIKNIEKTKKH